MNGMVCALNDKAWRGAWLLALFIFFLGGRDASTFFRFQHSTVVTSNSFASHQLPIAKRKVQYLRVIS